MEITPLRTRIIKERDDLAAIILAAVKKRDIIVKENDIFVIASKVISVSEGRVVDSKKIIPSKDANALAKKYALDDWFAELVLRESDIVLGGVPHAALTLKDGVFIANAGIDKSNAPKGKAILWPKDPRASAERIRKAIQKRAKQNVGVIISDSHCVPLRAGTTGLAIGIAGLSPTIDERGNDDLFGNKMRITVRAVADALASAAGAIMGETNERTPVVLIRGAPSRFFDERGISQHIEAKDCLFADIYPRKLLKDVPRKKRR